MIKIVSDSSCDILPEQIQELGIIIVPTHIIWDNKSYLDRVTMSAEEFYRRLPIDPAIPTSSQPSASQFQVAFEEAVAQGADEIICLTVSSVLSGTYNSAEIAAKTCPVPVHLVDSRAVSMHLGWQAIEAARAVKLGESAQKALEKVDAIRQKLVFSIGLPSLVYVARSGRLGPAFKWISSKVSVRPLVTINATTGKIDPIGVVRTKKTMLEKIYKHFKSNVENGLRLHVAIIQGAAEEEARLMAERIRQELKPVELLVTSTGPVLGLHTGPGTVGICGYCEEKY